MVGGVLEGVQAAADTGLDLLRHLLMLRTTIPQILIHDAGT